MVADEKKQGHFKVVMNSRINGTRIYAPDGTDISDYCSGITIVHKVGNFPRATLDIARVDLEAEINAENVSRIPLASETTSLNDDSRQFSPVINIQIPPEQIERAVKNRLSIKNEVSRALRSEEHRNK